MVLKPLPFSLTCTVGLIVFCLLTWFNLPDLEQYPIHWNAAGEVDGYAGRDSVFWALMILPITQLFATWLLYFLPKIEPLRQNFEDSRTAYDTIWMLIIAFMTALGVLICMLYHSNGAGRGSMIIYGISIGMSLLFMGIGNVLGKVRQNFLLGIRTPWTLSSESSWEKTHRVGGKLFVLVGLIGLLFSVLSPLWAIIGVIASATVLLVFCVVYSYKMWKIDPHKRS